MNPQSSMKKLTMITTEETEIIDDVFTFSSRDHLNETSTEPDVNMSTPTRVVLLSCGSFNPVTNMHMRMFELARDSLHKTGRYRVIGGIISPVADGYPKKGLLSKKHRTSMLELALKSTDWVRMDTWECDRETWLETALVMRHHKEKLDSQYNANLLPDTPTKKRKLDRENSPVDEVEYAVPSTYRNRNKNEPPKPTPPPTSGPVQLKLLCGADLLESFGTPGLWKEDHMDEIVGKHGLVCISRSGSNADKFIYESDLLYKNQNNIHLVTEWITNDISSTKIRRALQRGESVKYLLQDSVINYIHEHQLYGAGDNKSSNPENHCQSVAYCQETELLDTESIQSDDQLPSSSRKSLIGNQVSTGGQNLEVQTGELPVKKKRRAESSL